ARYLVLVCPLDEEGADRRYVLLVEHLLERRHSSVLHCSIEHDLVEEVVAEKARGAKIGNDASAHRVLTVANAAISLVELVAGTDRRRIGGRGRRVERQRLHRRGRGKRRSPADLEREYAADVPDVPGLRRVRAGLQGESGPEAGKDRN